MNRAALACPPAGVADPDEGILDFGLFTILPWPDAEREAEIAGTNEKASDALQ